MDYKKGPYSHLLDATVAELCEKETPGLYKVIQELIEQGATVKMIEARTAAAGLVQPGVLADIVYHTATHLKREKEKRRENN